MRDEITARFNDAGLSMLLMLPGRVRKEVLGQNARINPPAFWQADCGMMGRDYRYQGAGGRYQKKRFGPIFSRLLPSSFYLPPAPATSYLIFLEIRILGIFFAAGVAHIQ